MKINTNINKILSNNKIINIAISHTDSLLSIKFLKNNKIKVKMSLSMLEYKYRGTTNNILMRH